MGRRCGGAAGVGPNAAPCASREPRQAVVGARRRPLQNSQRVLLAAKPRTAAGGEPGCQATHRAMWRGGAMGTSRPTATGSYGNGRGRGAREGRAGRARRGGRMPSHAPRCRAATGDVARRREPEGPAAKHRALSQRDRMAMGASVVHASGVWQRGTREGRASGVRGRRGQGVILFSGLRRLAIPEFLRRFSKNGGNFRGFS